MGFVTRQNISVEEASLRTGKSVATIRRLLAAGRISGEKIGGRWLVHGDRLPARSQESATSTTDLPLDPSSAMSFLMKTDRRDLWVPDVLNWEDYRARPDALIRSALSKCSTGQSDPFEAIEIPKGRLLSRSGALLSLEDRLAYHMLCASFAPNVEAALSDRVFSSRLNKRPGPFFASGLKQFGAFLETVEVRAGDEDWVVSTEPGQLFRDH
jgi:excisionase family DNA binding protein